MSNATLSRCNVINVKDIGTGHLNAKSKSSVDTVLLSTTPGCAGGTETPNVLTVKDGILVTQKIARQELRNGTI